MTVCVTYSDRTNNDYSGMVDIPGSVTYNGKNYMVTAIGDYAFTGCTGLTSVKISSLYLTTIGSYAFSGCNGLKSFVFPKQVTSVGNYAFSGCFGISEISFPFAATQIWLGYGCSKGEKRGLFEDCLLEKVTIDRELNYNLGANYGYSPFANQGFLEDIEFGEDIEYIPGNVFYGNSAITSYTVPSHITQLGDYAFNGFTTAKHITLNEGTTAISNYAFSGCKNLKSFNIPSTVTTIGEGAFSGSGLTSIVIHPGIKSIGNFAFNNCSSLSQLTIEESENTLSLGYAYDSEWSDRLGTGMFSNSPLQSVFIGRPLSYNTSIRYGYSPFAYNETLKTARLGNPVTLIQPYLFANCTAFTTLNYNDNCNPKSVGNYAFWGCTSLTESDINLPESVNTIGAGAFQNCTSLRGFTIPNHIFEVKEYAFAGCDKLANLIIKPSVNSIGNFAFNNCSSLSQLTIEESENTLSLGYAYDSEWSDRLGTGMFSNSPLQSVFIGRPLSYNTSIRYGYSPFAYNETLKDCTARQSSYVDPAIPFCQLHSLYHS